MNDWRSRPPEEAFLLNPAFLAALLIKTVEGYESVIDEGAPLPYLFLAPPLVLPARSRNQMPRSVATSLAAWLQANPETHANVLQRLTLLNGYVREALLFALIHNGLTLLDNGLIGLGSVRIRDAWLKSGTEEYRECISKSRFVGRWLAGAGTTPTVLAAWGVRS
jgi:hypothetical protein